MQNAHEKSLRERVHKLLHMSILRLCGFMDYGSSLSTWNPFHTSIMTWSREVGFNLPAGGGGGGGGAQTGNWEEKLGMFPGIFEEKKIPEGIIVWEWFQSGSWLSVRSRFQQMRWGVCVFRADVLVLFGSSVLFSDSFLLQIFLNFQMRQIPSCVSKTRFQVLHGQSRRPLFILNSTLLIFHSSRTNFLSFSLALCSQ